MKTKPKQQATQQQIKILIADDHPIFRRGLKNAFSENSHFVVAGEASNCTELLEKARKEDYQIVLLDISMGGENSLDALKQIKLERPRLPVLVLSVYPEDTFAVRFIKAGALGYLTKDEDPDVLIEAIQKVAQGGRYTSPGLTEKLAFDFANQDKPPHEYLSDREYQVFMKIVQGVSLTKIAHELSLSVKTIGTHRTHALKKMKMKTNAQLIQYAIMNRII